MIKNIIEIKELKKVFNKTIAVDNLNFDDVKLRDDITCLSIKIN